MPPVQHGDRTAQPIPGDPPLEGQREQAVVAPRQHDRRHLGPSAQREWLAEQGLRRFLVRALVQQLNEVGR